MRLAAALVLGAVAGHQVDGRARQQAVLVQFGAGDGQRRALAAHQRVGGLAARLPGRQVGRFRLARREAGRQRRQLQRRAAHRFAELRLAQRQLGLGRQQPRQHAIEPRLRFLHLGDLAMAHLEAGLGTVALLQHGGLFGLLDAQRLLRHHHVQVDLGHAQHQRLALGVEAGRGQRALLVQLLAAGARALLVQRLHHAGSGAA